MKQHLLTMQKLLRGKKQGRGVAFLLQLLLVCCACTAGCFRTNTQSAISEEVVVYCALDQEFSEPILQQYAQELSINILPKYDIESTKTVGLANAILQEQARPRCDLFWNNEILHTLRLAKQGVIEPFEIPASQHFPAQFQATNKQWYGFAARARVLLVNTELVEEERYPKSIEQLNNPQWQGKVGMAKPLFGTTATHAAVLFATWGDAQATEFFRQFKTNGKIFSGNKQVAQAVSSGQIAFGITDTDDAILELEAGHSVKIIFPDQDPGQLGTLLIPNTLCLVKHAPHAAMARKLAAKIVSLETEEKLAREESAQIPLHDKAKVNSRVLPAPAPRFMSVDFPAAAEKWDKCAEVMTELFTGA
jgi:iron(III) transport system substrate-binding protein